MEYLYVFLIVIGTIAMTGLTIYMVIDKISSRNTKRICEIISVAYDGFKKFVEEGEKKNTSMFDDILNNED